MQFSKLATILSLTAVSIAAPAFEKRTGSWGQPSPSHPPPQSGQTCNQNAVAVCNAGGGDWVRYGDNENDCPAGNAYCCSSGDKSTNIASCSNILSGNTVTIPVTVLPEGLPSLLHARGQWGGGSWGQPEHPPPSGQTCNQNAVAYCNAGGDDWVRYGDNKNECPAGNVFCCSSGDDSTNTGSCSNILSGNTVKIPINILGWGGSIERRTWGGSWGQPEHPPPQSGQTCNQNAVAVCNAGGGDFYRAGDNVNKCPAGNVYCCESGKDSTNEFSCSDVGSGNTIKIPINILK